MLSFFVLVARAALRAGRALSERRRNTAALRDLHLLDERALRDLGLSHRAAAEFVGAVAAEGDRRFCP